MVIPSIHLVNGKVAESAEDQYQPLKSADPLELALGFDRYGEMALIDLDAEHASGDNSGTIKEVLRIAECRIGGGIATVEKAKELISHGAKKIIVGSNAFESGELNRSFLSGLVGAMGRQKMMISVDVLDRHGTIKDSSRATVLNIFSVVREIEQYASGLLIRPVSQESALQCAKMVRRLKDTSGCEVTLAADAASLDQIKELTEIRVDVQIDMTAPNRGMNLGGAFIESLDWRSANKLMPDGSARTQLLPTITQDQAGQVLTLAYSSKDSLGKTFETGTMWYFSRSRNRLWMKGETSGNTQRLVRIRQDCDADALLATVEQRGVACHTGWYSCFGDKKFSLSELYGVVKDRIEHPTPESYTSKLTDGLLKEKLIEEAHELVDAKGRDEVIWEAADVLYFLTVLLAKSGVEIDDVMFELARRRRR